MTAIMMINKSHFILDDSNFPLFILTFALGLGFAIYTYHSYHRTFLIYLSIAMYGLVALRACTEFWLQLTDDYQIVNLINQYNSIIVHSFFTLMWYTLYFYILPFKGWKYEKWIHLIVAIFIIGIPNLAVLYWFYTFEIIDFSNTRIDGFWMYRHIPSAQLSFYYLYVYIILGIIFTTGLMLYSIIKDPIHRRNKIISIVLFNIVIFLMFGNRLGITNGEWRVSNQSIVMLMDSLVVTLFVSGYRMIRDPFQAVSADVLNSLSELIIRTDKKMNVLHMNASAQEVFDSSGKFFIDSIIKSKEHYPKIESLILSQKDKVELDVNIGNRSRVFITQVKPYIWRGKNVGYSFVLNDITELKENEAQLIMANRTKDQLFSIIAHDMRKPVLAFSGITKKVHYLLGKRDFESLDRLGGFIEQSAQSLNALLDNLLTWALSQKDMLRVNKKPTDIKDTIDEAIEMLHTIIEQKNIGIETKGIEPNQVIHTDPDILITIVRNLLDNAVKYSPMGGRVEISTKECDNGITILIQDYGSGMTEEQVVKASMLYQNKSRKGTSGERGSGLGLALVHELIEKLDGTLSIESQLGHGTMIFIKLPKM